MSIAKLALDHAPDVYQFLGSKPYKDYITPIYFGEEIKQDLEPTCYYEVAPHGEDNIVVYHYFHRFSEGVKIPFIGAVGGHPFDWEGVVKFIRADGTVEFTATRCHFNLLFWRGDLNIVEIDCGTHAIYPRKNHYPGNHKVYWSQDFGYQNITNHYKLFYERIFPIFRAYGVDTWREWNDSRIARKFSIARTAGLIWKDPMKLYKYALKRGVVENV